MIHVQTWTGSQSVRITDMANAGKRGKTCALFHFSGWIPDSAFEPYRSIASFTRDMLSWASSLDSSMLFESARNEARLRFVRFQDQTPSDSLTWRDETIRGIDAPREKLLIECEGKWNASADESGITINDLIDQNNLPCMITGHGQTHARAYEIARRVWDRVKSANTFHEAGNVLREAGCKLHYFCRMD